MAKLSVKHYLEVYQIRKEMQELGITNPSPEIKKFTSDLVDKLSSLPLNEEIILDDRSFFDSKGKLIATFPIS
jgi:hypothetical protein